MKDQIMSNNKITPRPPTAKRGPKEDRLKITGDWELAVKEALRKPDRDKKRPEDKGADS